MQTLRDEILANARGPVVDEGRGYELAFGFGPDFVGFSGHFPGHPVLPAFVQLLTAQCAYEIRTGRRSRLTRVLRGKFLKPIQPDQCVVVSWQEKLLDDGLRGSFTLSVNDEKAASFRVELVVEEPPHA